ncbi:cation transporter [Streptomyces sp. NPDC059874]|uniref:cation transporter n=1 Tax=Streptomyces sp. NPDC059874 TaxID=3346983 RepID=UPI00365B659E
MSWLRRLKGSTVDREAADPGAVVLRIEGMHCSSCVLLVDEELEELAGVRSARTSLRDARAVVRLDQPGAVHTDELVAAVERAGYRAVPIN